MRWLVTAMVALWLSMPAPTWAQDQIIGPPVMPVANDSVGQAVGATLKSAWGGAQIPFDDQVGLWDSIVAFLNMGISSKDNWITVAQRLGLIEGTKIGHTNGGGGAQALSWCEDFKYVRDIAGNFIVPGVKYRMPKMYERPQTVYQTTSPEGMTFNTGELMGAFAIANWAANANLKGDMRFTGVYWGTGTNGTYSIIATRRAYWDGTKIVAMARKTLIASINSVAWYPEYTGGPPPSWKAADSVCTGAGVNHWKNACVAPPNDWNIPSEGVVAAADMPVWLKAGAGDLGLCPISDEFIRQIAEKAWQAVASQPGYTGPPAKHIEPEHVKHGSSTPTVNDLQDLTKPATPPEGTTPQPEPTTTPTDTPTTGPDWTNPGTGAPNPQTPTAQSIVDKAFDWGFPAIQINLGSATCPIYTADFYGHTLTLDSHCPFIEQNRAIISAMMLLLFTIAAGIIVLRA